MNTKNEVLRGLIPVYENVKSYYNKAMVIEGSNRIDLYSYDTLVATIHKNEDFTLSNVVVYGTYSSTTLRHIKEFLKQYGYEAKNKKQIETDYILL